MLVATKTPPPKNPTFYARFFCADGGVCLIVEWLVISVLGSLADYSHTHSMLVATKTPPPKNPTFYARFFVQIVAYV